MSWLSWLRHPSIVDLNLFTITHPRNHHLPQRLLPALKILRADPWLISWFLNRKQPSKTPTSLDMGSEVYPLHLHFNYIIFDDALYLLPHGTPHVTALHISQENSPPAALKGVTTLNLSWSFWSIWWSDVRALIPQFLTRFPQLQHLTYASPPPDVERAKQMFFIQEIMLVCPGMKTVTIELGSPVNLDTLRN